MGIEMAKDGAGIGAAGKWPGIWDSAGIETVGVENHGARQHWVQESWGLPGVSIINIWGRIALVVIVVIDDGTGAPLTCDTKVEDH